MRNKKLPDVIRENKQGEAGLMETLKDLRERISELETEKASLVAEIEKLKKTAEARAASLEKEVAALKDEAESLKKILA